MAIDSPKLLGYTRVSTDDQAERGASLKDQPERIRAFAAVHLLDLGEIIEDAGECSRSLDRPGLKRVLGLLDSGQAAGVVVAYLDRLTRHVGDMSFLVERYFLADDGCRLYSASDHVETRTASGRMLLYIQIAVSQYQRESIVERTADAMSAKRTRGERLGQVPYGWTHSAEGKELVPDRVELEALALMRTLAHEGLTFREIAAQLDARGFPPKRGGAKWSRSSVGQILARSGSGGQIPTTCETGETS